MEFKENLLRAFSENDVLRLFMPQLDFYSKQEMNTRV